MARKIEYYVRHGCKGFGEHKVSLPIDHTLSKAIYKTCNKLEIPILIHFGSLHKHDYFNPDVAQFEQIAADYPQATFIAHGPGWWREISADAGSLVDYPSGRIVPFGRADRILERCPNVHADISGTSGLNALVRDPIFAMHFLKRHQHKLHFGTDYPFFLLDVVHDDSPVTVPFGLDRRHFKMLGAMHLNSETMERIARGNTLRILDLT